MRPPSPLKNTEWTLAKKTYKLMQLKPKLRPAALVRGQDEVVNRFQLQLSGSNWCAESEHEVTRRKGALVLNKCNAIKRQMWSETHSKQLLLAGLLCLDGNTNAPYLEKCHQLGGTQEWRHSSQVT